MRSGPDIASNYGGSSYYGRLRNPYSGPYSVDSYPLQVTETWNYAAGKLSVVGAANWTGSVGTKEMQTLGSGVLGVEAGDTINPKSPNYGHLINLIGSRFRMVKIRNLVGANWPLNSSFKISLDRTTINGSGGASLMLSSFFDTAARLRLTLATSTGSTTYDYATSGQGNFNFDSVELLGFPDGSFRAKLNGAIIMIRSGAVRASTFKYWGLDLSEAANVGANTIRVGTLTAYGYQS